MLRRKTPQLEARPLGQLKFGDALQNSEQCSILQRLCIERASAGAVNDYCAAQFFDKLARTVLNHGYGGLVWRSFR